MRPSSALRSSRLLKHTERMHRSTLDSMFSPWMIPFWIRDIPFTFPFTGLQNTRFEVLFLMRFFHPGGLPCTCSMDGRMKRRFWTNHIFTGISWSAFPPSLSTEHLRHAILVSIVWSSIRRPMNKDPLFYLQKTHWHPSCIPQTALCYHPALCISSSEDRPAGCLMQRNAFRKIGQPILYKRCPHRLQNAVLPIMTAISTQTFRFLNIIDICSIQVFLKSIDILFIGNLKSALASAQASVSLSYTEKRSNFVQWFGFQPPEGSRSHPVL